MGLIHPRSLERWQEWERSKHRARRAQHAVSEKMQRRARRESGEEEQPPSGYEVISQDGERSERLLIAVDSATPRARASLLTALPYLRWSVDLLVPAGMELPEVDETWSRRPVADPAREAADLGPAAVLSLGQHRDVGFAAHQAALRSGARSFVVQYGALTPYAPPPPPGSTLLSWSAADGEFITEDRPDVVFRAVGSQLLWQAAHDSYAAALDAVTEDQPVFLGQMQGPELPRRLTAGTAYRFCRENEALYRPHPEETDVASRAMHELFRRRGITITDPEVLLKNLPNPVVGMFSTGILEAAVRGIPAWVHLPGAPDWVEEFWDRYGLRRFGSSEPSPAPKLAVEEPASLIAQVLEGDA